MSRIRDLLAELREPLLNVSIRQEPSGASDAPTVVLIHGIASSSSTFDFVVPLISDTHRVIAIDLLGFGGSPAPDGAEYTLDEHVAAISHTIRHLHLEHFVLVGHSLGCLIGSRYAARHGRHLDKLVLVSPPVYPAPSEIGDPLTRAQVSGYLAIYKFLRNNKDFTIAHASRVAKLLPIEHVMEITETNWTAFVKSLENCIETQTIISDLAAVDVPVEIVYGRFDEFLVPGSLAILSKMRGVTTHRVEVSDHVIRRPMARVVAQAIDSSTE